MKRVIMVGEEPKEKGIELTHYLSSDLEWTEDSIYDLIPSEVLYYLGNDAVEGDMFMTKDGEFIRIYKGHLNNGTY